MIAAYGYKYLVTLKDGCYAICYNGAELDSQIGPYASEVESILLVPIEAKEPIPKKCPNLKSRG